MDVVYLLVLLAVVIAILIVAAFFWAVKTGQFDDLSGPAHRILMDDDAPRAPAPRSIGILIVGDEILSGRRQDRHFAHAVEALARRSLRLHWARMVGDDLAALTDTLRQVRASGDICFGFGGIGATPDDLTRQAVARAWGVPLVRHAGAVAEIEAGFGAEAYPNRILMADLPQGALPIPNPVNRVPGFSLDHLHCLPGFPEMAWPMMEWVLDRFYEQLAPTKPAEASLVVEQAHESDLIPWMNEFVRSHPQLKLFSLPRLLTPGKAEIELGVSGDPAAVRAGLDEIVVMLERAGYRYRHVTPV